MGRKLRKKIFLGIVLIALFAATLGFNVGVVYGSQFYLQLVTDPPQVQTIDPSVLSGGGWHNSGVWVMIYAKPYVIDTEYMVRYDFVSWVGADNWDPNAHESVDPSNNTNFKFMDGNYTVTATYRISFYLKLVTDPPEVLTVDPNALAGKGWQSSGSYVLIDAKQTVTNASFRYDFVDWVGADFPGPSGDQAVMFMDASHTVTAVYQRSVRAFPTTWTVDDDGPADFKTIQSAVDAAYPYDTILVRSGHYTENVSMNTNNLQIFGEDRNTTIVYGGFYLHTWYSVIANFTLNDLNGADMYGFVFDQSSFNVVRKNLITGFTGGMYFNNMNDTSWPPVLEPASCHDNVVTDNVIRDCTWEDIFFMVGFTNNSFYNNDFFMPRLSDIEIDYIESFNEFWDAGYPCGGNYWADYNGSDVHSGAYQNLTGSDGIGDTPYTIPGVEYPVVVDIDNYPLMSPWMGTVDDLAVLNVNPNKTVVGVGQVMYVDVLIANTGDYTESVNPHCYANGTSTTRLHILPTSLNSDYCKVFRFAWNTSGFAIGIYSMSGTASAVANETHTSDNTLIQGWVTVSVQGDLNGDFTVNIFDAILLSNAYNSQPSSPNWKPNADINNDNIVNILDAIILSNHYLQHYP